MRFAKYQALGNDYLVVDAAEWGAVLTPPAVRRVCDRHFGVGSDGILVRLPARDAEPFGLRILNPDGSEAEKSGNGLRIFARYLWDMTSVGEAPFAVSTPGGEVRCRVTDRGRSVGVEMGEVRFQSREIPVLGPAREVLRETLAANGQVLEYSAASVGNPHCVILRDRPSEAEARLLGPIIETDPRFPNRTNVQFVQVVDPRRIRIEIWERGAGYTLASGTSSCAAAAVARRLGLCESSVTVQMPGGSLLVELGSDFRARLSGPVGKVAEGRVSHEVLMDLSDEPEGAEKEHGSAGPHRIV